MKRSLSLILLAAACLAACGEDKPAPSSIVINELVPSNQAGCADEQGELDDWVELYNKGDHDQSLEGYYVTDDPAVPLKKRLGAGLVVPARGVLLLWTDKSPEQGAAHLPFKLDAKGEAFQLRGPDEQLLDEYTFSDAATDVSFARFPDGDGAFASCTAPTCGAANGSACSK
ncbi:MAG: lamin tail domain-containing protein [Deltaproteobacteria bacterium]|nr:lamin tail domain-containing protein [Deltaproteobacteria bacterium]